jgi:hypothetical protein
MNNHTFYKIKCKKKYLIRLKCKNLNIFFFVFLVFIWFLLILFGFYLVFIWFLLILFWFLLILFGLLMNLSDLINV